MNPLRTIALAGLLAVLSFDAQALGRLADVSIIDRDTGQVLPTHYYRGDYWVAGRPGARYAIAISNRSGERVLAVAAVDGVNVITGDSAAWSQSGYVFTPWQSYEISGWRKSDAEVAAFEFTAAPGAYATLTGRPANLGVIGVALFRERPTVALNQPAFSDERVQSRLAAEAAAPAALAQDGLQLAGRASAPLERLGTGHGQRESSLVTNTEFERLQQQPNEIVRIRYDSLSNLVAMGVLRQPGAERPGPDAFPESPVARYVPDPPRMR
jgi:hypothetical protein